MSNNELEDGNTAVCELQRDQERERRRLRDRQRRESMTAEEREKHLARRRRNYQLRRQRAGNAHSGSDGDQALLVQCDPRLLIATSDFAAGQSSGSNKEFGLGLSDLDARGTGNVGEKLSIFNRKLRLSEIRHLARSLDCAQRKLIAAYLFSKINSTSKCGRCRKLRVTQVKRLARELDSSMNDVTSQLKTRRLRNGGENPKSQEILETCSDLANTTEQDHSNYDTESPMPMEVDGYTVRQYSVAN
uniref:Uncharacterized protein n=1 Tax=Kalanchoe fedtschenkoi TaxID=63787 RepID=A0A7N0UBM8_KALFE